MTGFSAADELLLFEVYGINVTLAPDGAHLLAQGPTECLRAAEPKLRMHREALIAELRRRLILAPQRGR